jgi:hypothetical protein
MRTSKKKEIITSLEKSIDELISKGVEYCLIEDLTYSFTEKNGEKKNVHC